MSAKAFFNCSPFLKPFSVLLFSNNSASTPAKLIVAGITYNPLYLVFIIASDILHSPIKTS